MSTVLSAGWNVVSASAFQRRAQSRYLLTEPVPATSDARTASHHPSRS